ncbi:response regulator transcription factor [Actinomadura kijaniata]|uniref:response regulator transcription factor n=1 Tax=Actinomadura kijaniata TaxID=46161 RepID=UPI003F1DBD46
MIRVLLAEDQHVIRGALAALLNLEADLEVVAEASDGAEAVDRALALRPDVAVMDIDMPRKDGLEAAAELRERLPSCKALMLTAHGRPGHLRRALDVRVQGFLLKTAPPEELAAAVRRVASGERVLDPSLAVTAWDLSDNPLTPRERDVLALAAEGAEPGEIAARLHLSPGTVRNNLTAVITKLNARGRTDAVRIAAESGWI